MVREYEAMYKEHFMALETTLIRPEITTVSEAYRVTI